MKIRNVAFVFVCHLIVCDGRGDVASRRLSKEQNVRNLKRSKHAKGSKGKGASTNKSTKSMSTFSGEKISKGRHSQASASGCNSPFGYGKNELDRLVKCFGAGNIVVAAYRANVAFVTKAMAAVAAMAHDNGFLDERYIASGFHFFMQAESGKCEDTVPSYLCDLLECGAVHTNAVGSFIKEVVADPESLPTDVLSKLCRGCGAAYDGNCLDTKMGGSGSGSGMQLYCTDVKRNESTPLLTVGGGGGSGAGPGFSWGGGGGAGMQILLEKVDGNVSCIGGGCGSGRDMTGDDHRCPKLRGKTDSVYATTDLVDDVVRDEGCETDEFVRGITLVKEAVSEYINNPRTKLSVSAGGGSGGGANKDEKLLHRFSTGFRFRAGPEPVLSDSSMSGGGNTTDSQLKEECAFAYADAVCANAGYLGNYATSFELCQCPVRNMYNPGPGLPSDCSFSSNDPDPDTPPVDVDLLMENCEDWCPDQGSVTTAAGEDCPVLLPACSCKA